MTPFASMVNGRGATRAVAEEARGLLLGAGFTLALFSGLAHFEHFDAADPATAIEDLRPVVLPLEPPPPPPRRDEPAPEPAEAGPLSGLEASPSDSPVSIAVVPPDLESLFPATTLAPRARIQVAALPDELKPRVGLEAEVSHVYQDVEVDQHPRALVRTNPPVPRDVIGTASVLRVVLTVVINQQGKAENVRVMESSGNPRFDEIVARTVQEEWLYSPGLRRGRKVRVLAQQAFKLTISNGTSPYSLD